MTPRLLILDSINKRCLILERDPGKTVCARIGWVPWRRIRVAGHILGEANPWQAVRVLELLKTKQEHEHG